MSLLIENLEVFKAIGLDADATAVLVQSYIAEHGPLTEAEGAYVRKLFAELAA